MREPATAFTRPARVASVVSLVAVAAGGLLALYAVQAGAGTLLAAIVVVGLLVGVPHGALDHLVPSYHGAPPAAPAAVRLAGLTAGYALCAAAVWVVWQSVPGLALVLFLLLSCAHFGSGETAFAALRAGRVDERSWPGALALGAVIVLLPVLTHRAEVAPYLAALVPGWDGALPGRPAALAAILLVGTGLALVCRRVALGRLLEAVEVLVLLVSALLVPPAVSLALYFGAWHSVRHLAIVLADDPANAEPLTVGRLAGPAKRLALRAALPSAAALAVLWLLWRTADGDIFAFVAVDVPLLAALTVPHALVVWWSEGARDPAARGQVPSTRTGLRPATETVPRQSAIARMAPTSAATPPPKATSA